MGPGQLQLSLTGKRASVAHATSSTLHLIKMASTEVGFSP